MRRIIAYIAIVVVLVAGSAALYSNADMETLELDDAARREAPGEFVRLTDGYTHYELGGPVGGPLVVLAAGFSVPYYIWDPTFTALTDAGFRTLRYDYYGRGFSDRPDVPYTQAFYVRQLTELLDALSLTAPFDLVGLSLGGAIVTAVADGSPDRVRSLVFVDPSFRKPGPPPTSAPAVWDFFTTILAAPRWPDEQLKDFLHPERFPEWPDRYRVQMRYRGFRRARLSELMANAAVDQGEEIQRVGQHPRRVLVIWGKQDTQVPVEESASLLEAMPRARFVPVEESGHLPQWEQPDIFNETLIDFLREVNGSSPS
jgi:pimeloyl-ACP methyl ester carboxylesterase